MYDFVVLILFYFGKNVPVLVYVNSYLQMWTIHSFALAVYCTQRNLESTFYFTPCVTLKCAKTY